MARSLVLTVVLGLGAASHSPAAGPASPAGPCFDFSQKVVER